MLGVALFNPCSKLGTSWAWCKLQQTHICKTGCNTPTEVFRCAFTWMQTSTDQTGNIPTIYSAAQHIEHIWHICSMQLVCETAQNSPGAPWCKDSLHCIPSRPTIIQLVDKPQLRWCLLHPIRSSGKQVIKGAGYSDNLRKTTEELSGMGTSRHPKVPKSGPNHGCQ